MLIAYIDEIGETGAFVSRDDKRFNTSPAFGYAGFIIPDSQARRFGAVFATEKRKVFKSLIEAESDPAHWERKGADIFNATAPNHHPEQLRVFDNLVNSVSRMGGNLFYYADEKPLGTPKQTQLDTTRREREAMQETLNRLARHAELVGSNMMVVIDQINEKVRSERISNMYSHILSRATDYPEMRRIIEPPMHVDSQLSSNIQFADWVAACVGRAIDYQLLENSRYQWVTDSSKISSVYGKFTYESKVHLCHRSIEDINHSGIFYKERILDAPNNFNPVVNQLDPEVREKMAKIHAASIPKRK